VERFNLRNLNELEVRKRYQIEISDRFAALYVLYDSEEINRAWEALKRISKPQLNRVYLVLYELKQHKPWYDEECLGFLDQRKQATMHWLQDPNQSTVDNLNSVRHEVSRHFMNNKKKYLKAKIHELETLSKIKNIRLD
jgi:hypothetical protein